jgi:hypothetical protein
VALLLSRHLCAVMKLLAARTSTQNSRHSALVSSMVQGGGKRRADGMGHGGGLTGAQRPRLARRGASYVRRQINRKSEQSSSGFRGYSVSNLKQDLRELFRA